MKTIVGKAERDNKDWKKRMKLEIVGPPKPFGKKKIINCLKFLIPERIKEHFHNQFAEVTKQKILRQWPKLFRILHLETRTICNGKCNFCPAGHLKRKDKMMSEELYLKILHELKDYEGRMTLYCNNEPLLDPRLIDWLKIARKLCPKALLEIKTNGKVLTIPKLKELIATVDWLCISDYGRENDFHKNIKEAICFLKDGHLRSECLVEITYRREDDILDNRAGHSPNRRPKNLHRFCSRPFEMLTVGTEGQIGLCGCDFDFSYTIGNAYKMTLQEAWNGNLMKYIRSSMLRNDRTCTPPCSICDFHSYFEEDLKGKYRLVKWI